MPYAASLGKAGVAATAVEAQPHDGAKPSFWKRLLG
jgi:hypothetical protein